MASGSVVILSAIFFCSGVFSTMPWYFLRGIVTFPLFVFTDSSLSVTLVIRPVTSVPSCRKIMTSGVAGAAASANPPIINTVTAGKIQKGRGIHLSNRAGTNGDETIIIVTQMTLWEKCVMESKTGNHQNGHKQTSGEWLGTLSRLWRVRKS